MLITDQSQLLVPDYLELLSEKYRIGDLLVVSKKFDPKPLNDMYKVQFSQSMNNTFSTFPSIESKNSSMRSIPADIKFLNVTKIKLDNRSTGSVSQQRQTIAYSECQLHGLFLGFSMRPNFIKVIIETAFSLIKFKR
jgi:hypothetical protein